ncbi:MAG TPA: hypothetical protein VL088_02695 [Pedobacter sp.]|nr:hypothetical protein [Pedobacter sp.]
MKKTILTGAVMVALLTSLCLQSCNSEKKAETTDTLAKDTMAVDTAKMAQDTAAIDTGVKGTKVPAPK